MRDPYWRIWNGGWVMTSDERQIQGGGGITHGEGARSPGADNPSDPAELMRTFRRRWASGVAILTTGEENNWRGITLTAVMPLSLDPPTVAVGLTAAGEFASTLGHGQRCGLSILQRQQVFLSERFAGRAPLADRAFGGIPFDLDDAGVPLIRGAAAALSCSVDSITNAGDHVLVVLRTHGGVIGPNEDDPLITYEGGYRGLEVD